MILFVTRIVVTSVLLLVEPVLWWARAVGDRSAPLSSTDGDVRCAPRAWTNLERRALYHPGSARRSRRSRTWGLAGHALGAAIGERRGRGFSV